jgi:hypothetical protein
LLDRDVAGLRPMQNLVDHLKLLEVAHPWPRSGYECGCW